MSTFIVQAVDSWRVTVLEDRGDGHTTTWEFPLPWVDGPVVGEPLSGLVTDHIRRMRSAGLELASPQASQLLKEIADIAHEGGLRNMSESDALNEIRRLSLPYWEVQRGRV